MLQCVVVWSSMLVQCVACALAYMVATLGHWKAVLGQVSSVFLQCGAVCCSVVQCAVVCCSVL